MDSRRARPRVPNPRQRPNGLAADDRVAIGHRPLQVGRRGWMRQPPERFDDAAANMRIVGIQRLGQPRNRRWREPRERSESRAATLAFGDAAHERLDRQPPVDAVMVRFGSKAVEGGADDLPIGVGGSGPLEQFDGFPVLAGGERLDRHSPALRIVQSERLAQHLERVRGTHPAKDSYGGVPEFSGIGGQGLRIRTASSPPIAPTASTAATAT